ncbi:unnamed protein product [Paramecium octaurelia]|uniref:Uncharacterized protein n=1 Tax=Paramecium octaurelia TaxID=43137 RepID=A0A8S1V716_PAROT|nr:unnamed protein product [Paramecium octaurelia]
MNSKNPRRAHQNNDSNFLEWARKEKYTNCIQQEMKDYYLKLKEGMITYITEQAQKFMTRPLKSELLCSSKISCI